MLRLIIVVGTYQGSDTHRIYTGILNAMFPKSTSHVFSSSLAVPERLFVIYTKETKPLLSLSQTLTEALKSAGGPNTHMILGVEGIRGGMNARIFGQKAVDEIAELHDVFLKQSTIENKIDEMQSEINANS